MQFASSSHRFCGCLVSKYVFQLKYIESNISRLRVDHLCDPAPRCPECCDSGNLTQFHIEPELTEESAKLIKLQEDPD